MPADRQFLPSIKHLLLQEEDCLQPWSVARHQHIIGDYDALDNDKLSLGPTGFPKPAIDQTIYHHSRHSPSLDLHISRSSTPTSSPSSTWSPKSNDSGEASHNVAQPQSMWGSTIADRQSNTANTKKHSRSFSEVSQLQDLNVYHRRQSAGDRQYYSSNDVPNSYTISPKSAFKDARQTVEEDANEISSTTTLPPHDGIIVFGTKTIQNTTQQASSGHRYVCQDCSKTFARPSSLRVHSYSHTGEKPYACPDPSCGRRFSVCSNLRRHMRVHRLHHDPPQWKPKASIDSNSQCRATSI